MTLVTVFETCTYSRKRSLYIGRWKIWHEQEHLVCIVEYGNGNPPFFVTRFRPDGTVCETGEATLLHTIFTVLFQDASALEDVTPIRKKALLAAAEVVMKDPGFINHKEVFDSFDLPHDAYALKQLAQSAN